MGLMGFLAVVGLVAGILVGTHAPWWAEVILVIAAVVVLEKSNLEMAAIIFVPMVSLFAAGCVIGDISWALQSGAITLQMPDWSNPFAIKDHEIR